MLKSYQGQGYGEKKLKIGIPRGLTYYTYYPFWHAFFEALGVEVVLSDKTTKQIVSDGSALVVTETCLPVKVFLGHVINLLNKGIDIIYCPSIQSIEPKIYNCSKIRGLPDLVRNVIKRNYLLIEPTFDMSEKGQTFEECLYQSVVPLGIKDRKKVKKATDKGWEAQHLYEKMLHYGIEANKAIEYAIKEKEEFIQKNPLDESKINIALISHGYNIFDEHISMKVIQKLRKMGANVYFAGELSKDECMQGFKNLDTTLYWANEYEMSGAAGYYMNDAKIDGLITITSFGCGPDSIMIERMTRYSKQFKKPLLNLTIDEHTGEAGFITRLEAFTDMIFRTKRVAKIKALKKQEMVH